MRRFYFLMLLFLFPIAGNAQRMLSDMMDTTTELGKGYFSVYQRFNWLRISGYLQTQYQWAESKGAPSFEGGDFAPNSDNRFTIRRGRMRLDYQRLNEEGYPTVNLVFQFDGTEKGWGIRDFWGRVFENKWHLFSLTTGMFARPFGFEVNLGSADRESPERGRMSQLLMRAERDLGAMLTLEPRAKDSRLKWLRADLSVTNGQGLSAPTDYDSHKDLIGRVAAKPTAINKKGWKLSGGISGFAGGIVSQSAVTYETAGSGAGALMQRDSSAGNIDRLTPRRYYGADVQFRIPNKHGATELRAEYIRGQQTGTAGSSETPGTYPVSGTTPAPLYTRTFDGAYFYLLQHLGSTKHQVVLKYDWYDPNTKVKGGEITTARGFTGADVKFRTFGAGYNYYINPNLRALLYYDHVVNEGAAVNGFNGDLKDDVFTFRIQYRF